MTNVTKKLIAYADGQLHDDESEEIEAVLIRYVDQLLNPSEKSEVDDAIDQSPALTAIINEMREGQGWFKQVFAPNLKPLLDGSASPRLQQFVDKLTTDDVADTQDVANLRSDNVVASRSWQWQHTWPALAASIMTALMIGAWSLHTDIQNELSEARSVQAKLALELERRKADQEKLEQELERREADQERQAAQIVLLEDQVRQQQTVDWTSEVAKYHGLYARQSPRRLVEVPANEHDHIVTWLGEQLGQPFSIPDLTEANITFKGARLLAIGGMPVAQLMYIDGDGEPLAFCFMRNMSGGEKLPELSEHKELKLIDWSDEAYQYAIVGATTFSTLEALAYSLKES